MLLGLESKSTGHQNFSVPELSGGFQRQASSLPYIPGLASAREEGGFGRLGEEERLPGGGGGGCLPGLLTSLSTGQEGPSSDSAPSGLSWVGACREEASPPAQSSLCHHLQAPSCVSAPPLSKVPNLPQTHRNAPQASGRQSSGASARVGSAPSSQGHSATRTGLCLEAWRTTLNIRS